jgi:gluconate 2-dehydrogenase gamma chain
MRSRKCRLKAVPLFEFIRLCEPDVDRIRATQPRRTPMPRNGRLPRRRFLSVAASTAAATVACTGPKGKWRFFTDAEATTLAALCDQIIPPDHHAGASEAGVVHYIDRQLKGHFRALQADYRMGLAALNAAAVKQYGQAFAALPGDRQAAMLRKIERAKDESAAFFSMAIAHTMQGYYGSPRHGGNRNWLSWRMLGVPTAPVRGRIHYDLTAES